MRLWGQPPGGCLLEGYEVCVCVLKSACYRDQPVERDPEELRKEMERLEIIRKKRCDIACIPEIKSYLILSFVVFREVDRKKRIEQDGWDRFAPISETNKP